MQRGRGVIHWSPQIHIEALESGWVLFFERMNADIQEAHAFETMEALLVRLREHMNETQQQVLQEVVQHGANASGT